MHDLARQLNYLTQCLASDKRPLALFLGAGCPLAVPDPHEDGKPLIPAIAGLTEAVLQAVGNGDLRDKLALLVAELGNDGYTDPTVEDLLSRIRALRGVVGAASVRGLSAADLDALDEATCSCLVDLVDQVLPATDTAYHRVSAWIGAASRSWPIEVFTTNYDLLLEQALEANRVPYFDGFVGSSRPFFDTQAVDENLLPPRWARLWKLHGSLNWRERDGDLFRGEGADADRLVIYPSHLKYNESRRMPYLAMTERLRSYLRQPSAVLVIVGYSFGDQHLNEVILSGLQGSPSSMAFALAHGTLDGNVGLCDLARSRANLSVVASDGGLIGTKRGAWSRAEAGSEVPARLGATYEADEAQQPTGSRATICTLGDFGAFSDFVADLIGHEPVQ